MSELSGAEATREQRTAARLFDQHGARLLDLAQTLTTTRGRAERLVVDTISSHVGRSRRWRGRVSFDTLADGVHRRWISATGETGGLDDTERGMLALCLHGGHTYVTAGRRLGLSKVESARTLGAALRRVSS